MAETTQTIQTTPEEMTSHRRRAGMLKFFIFSGLGIFMFFVNVNINGVSVIPIQHIINLVKKVFAPVIPYYALAMVVAGGLIPVLNGSYKKSKFNLMFTGIKLFGIVIGLMAVFQVGPEAVMRADMIPFLFNSVVVPITIMIPVTGIAYVMLLNFGLVEFISAFMQPVMRKIWKTPGESAVDAVVSFSGGYALAVLLTNDLYKKGVYSAKESVIISTGFSTVAISFLIVIANTLGLMEHWTVYFFACFFVTFLVTAITARIYPIAKIPNSYYDKKAEAILDYSEPLIPRAYHAGLKQACSAKPLTSYLKEYYLGDAIKMSSAVTASILTIGLLGIVLAEYTPLFDVLGYLFYPFTWLLQLPEPLIAAKASAVEIAEMFLPSMLVVNSPLLTKFTIAITSVSAVLFFSASIPCLLSTDIPIKMKDVLLIWFERTVLSLIAAALIGHVLF